MKIICSNDGDCDRILRTGFEELAMSDVSSEGHNQKQLKYCGHELILKLQIYFTDCSSNGIDIEE